MEKVSQAPKNYPHMYVNFLTAAKDKLFNHSWYLSERLVVLCLASSELKMGEKVKMWKALKKMRNVQTSGTVGNGLKQQPLLTAKTNLEDLVGPDSWLTLDNLGVRSFLEKHPKHWNKDPCFLKMQKLVDSIPVLNDPVERVLGLVTSYFNLKTTPKTDEEKQNLFRVVHHYRLQQKELSSSSTERSTKKVLDKFVW